MYRYVGGEFSFDVLHKSVEYAKRFDLGEWGGVGGLPFDGESILRDPLSKLAFITM
jgi:hypothetical protein